MNPFHITHWALPCMSGATTSITTRLASSGLMPAGQLLGLGDGLRPPPATAHGGEEDVLLAPEHALGHAGGAAGVEHVDVVGRPGTEVALGGAGGQSRLVGHDVGTRGVDPRTVLDHHQVKGSRRLEPGQRFGHQAGQGPLEDQDVEVGVVDHVAELGGDVAIVDVHRYRPRLVAADHGLGPLGPVVGEDADVGAGGNTRGGQVMGEPVGPLVELAVGEAFGPRHQRQAVGDGVDHHFEQIGQVEPPRTHRLTPLSSLANP